MNVIYIRKPLSVVNGVPYVSIRHETLASAIDRREKLKVMTDYGEAIIDPKEWIKTGKRIKKVFKIPGHPMLLYANYVR